MEVGEYPWLTLSKAREELAALGGDTDPTLISEMNTRLNALKGQAVGSEE
jgi:hypothetical protein